MNDTNLVLQILVNNISLSDTAKERIAKEYEALAKLFDASDLDVDIKYQGSYALGTSIRPLNHDDDYDIDLVCILNNGLNNKPEEIKHSVGDVLLNSERYKDKVEENRRSWTVEYFNSHVDVLPSILDPDNNSDLLITDNKNGYNLINSSPFKFRDWFIRMSNYVPKSVDYANSIEEPVDQDDNDDKLKSIVKLLKFHRDKYFDKKDSELKPISMLLTIFAAQLYDNSLDLEHALQKVVCGIRGFLEENNNKVINPVDSKENFTDKWEEYPERKEAFFDWLSDIEKSYSCINLSKLKNVFGESRVQNAVKQLGEIRGKQRDNNLFGLNKDTGLELRDNKYSNSGYKRHTFYGD